MAKEEILAMRTGLDLDNLICGEIFGWKTFGSVKPYSTDISAAWLVVDKLTERNLFCSLDYLREQHWKEGKGDWRCRVVCGVKIEFVVAKDVPEAICKAALLAKLDAGGG